MLDFLSNISYKYWILQNGWILQSTLVPRYLHFWTSAANSKYIFRQLWVLFKSVLGKVQRVWSDQFLVTNPPPAQSTLLQTPSINRLHCFNNQTNHATFNCFGKRAFKRLQGRVFLEDSSKSSNCNDAVCRTALYSKVMLIFGEVIFPLWNHLFGLPFSFRFQNCFGCQD